MLVVRGGNSLEGNQGITQKEAEVDAGVPAPPSVHTEGREDLGVCRLPHKRGGACEDTFVGCLLSSEPTSLRKTLHRHTLQQLGLC